MGYTGARPIHNIDNASEGPLKTSIVPGAWPTQNIDDASEPRIRVQGSACNVADDSGRGCGRMWDGVAVGCGMGLQ